MTLPSTDVVTTPLATSDPPEAPPALEAGEGKKKAKTKKREGKSRKPKGLTEFEFSTEIKVEQGTRFIGIRHRVKKTADGEARPSQAAIFMADGNIKRIDFETEDDELNWVNGVFVTKRRALESNEDLAPLQAAFAKLCESQHLPAPPNDPLYGSLFLQLCAKRELKKKEEKPLVHDSQLISDKGKLVAVITDVPVEFDGLKPGDTHSMSLGGSGDRLAYALSRRSEHIQEQTGQRTAVFRTPPRILKEHRDRLGRDKDTDALSVVELLIIARNTFYECDVRDRLRIDVGEHVRNRRDTQDDRKRCEQRLRQRVIGGAFIRPGLYPEGSLEDRFRDARANDAALIALEAEEAKRDKAVEKSIEAVDVYLEILSKVTGVGPITGAELFTAIGDIRRFQVVPNQAELDAIRADSRRLLDEGKLLDDALDVIITVRHVRGEKSWVNLDKLMSEAGMPLSQAAAGLPDSEVETLVELTKAAAGESKLVDRLFEIRDRAVMDRFQLIGAVAAYKRANGKAEEADKLQQALECMKRAKHIKWKARERSKAKLRHHCGVHVRAGGKYADVPPEKAFPRARRGEVCNWNRMARQRLYLLVADQFNKRPGTIWGDKLRSIKTKLRETHPEPVKNEAGKSRYTDGHIHKMAIWKCASQFVDWLYDQWMNLEEQHKRKAQTKA